MTTTPQDHLPPAAQRETDDTETATIAFGDLTFTIPASLDDLDGEFLKYAADEDAYRMVETVLSGAQFAKFKATGPKVRDYRAVGDQIAQVYGFADAGE